MRACLAITVGITFAQLLRAERIEFHSQAGRTALLELYTSEGCSSCPPAEAWLSRLKDDPELWKAFVPAAFHVDYWNHLGWRDPWSSGRFTERQRGYAQAWNSETIYTPEFVLNGQEWRDWRAHRSVPHGEGAAGSLAVSSTNGTHWQVTFRPASPGGRYEVHAALLACRLSSDVKAGENRGRRLEHDFVVVSFVEKLMKGQADVSRDDCELKPQADVGGGHLALAVWVTQAGKATPLQATGGWLGASRR